MAAVETHTSVLLMTDELVWKVKKPVRFGFLDFSTRELRERACEREVVLNRRMAPDVYLGVGHLTAPDGRPGEPAVVMRRLPEERRLSTLVEAGVPVDDALRQLARQLAALHESEAPTRADPRAASTSALRTLWERNLREASRFRTSVLGEQLYDDIARLARRYLDGRVPLFDERAHGGWVRDGHGDLLADDVFCLDDGPRALDCIDFDDRFRQVDGLDDAAFLAMDLERLGAPALGAAFLQWYAEFRADPAPASLAHHFVAYRAFVRAMVTCLRHGQEGDAASATLAHRLGELAWRHLRAGAVRLVLIGGAPGTGKTTVAADLAARLGWVVLRSDVVRKELAGLAPNDRGDTALYADEVTRRTYAELLHRAEAALGHGESVLLDASWTRAGDREAARLVAERTASDLIELRCEAPGAVVRERVERRARTGLDASDADVVVAWSLAAAADPWPEARSLDTTGTPARVLENAVHFVAPETLTDAILVP